VGIKSGVQGGVKDGAVRGPGNRSVPRSVAGFTGPRPAQALRRAEAAACPHLRASLQYAAGKLPGWRWIVAARRALLCCMLYREQGARSRRRDGCVEEAGFATDRSGRCGGLRKFGAIVAGQFFQATCGA